MVRLRQVTIHNRACDWNRVSLWNGGQYGGRIAGCSRYLWGIAGTVEDCCKVHTAISARGSCVFCNDEVESWESNHRIHWCLGLKGISLLTALYT